MTTNGVESINSRLRYDRELPIISLLDALQKVTSGWFTRYRNAANECTTSVTPSVEKILRERFILSQTMHVEELNEMEYHVTGHGHNEIVDFGSKSCTCRVFDIDRIPCVHAIEASFKAKIGCYDLCSEYYSSNTWALAYAQTVYPVPEKCDWTVNNPEFHVLPPDLKIRRGRRTTNRIPFVGEFGRRK
ncbi:uncharacterized protein [Henckelia pumila]|uniref:uncharacterized protein n=1 Tax=Henckelia pumila TaxID=405737 RepID=UPI003C6DBA9D